jgi:hypothetical protein
MFEPENLHPDLEMFIVTLESGMKMLNHPLVQEMFYTSNKSINLFYKHKTESLAKAIGENDWNKAIALHERPYRFNFFYQNSKIIFAQSPELYIKFSHGYG